MEALPSPPRLRGSTRPRRDVLSSPGTLPDNGTTPSVRGVTSPGPRSLRGTLPGHWSFARTGRRGPPRTSGVSASVRPTTVPERDEGRYQGGVGCRDSFGPPPPTGPVPETLSVSPTRSAGVRPPPDLLSPSGSTGVSYHHHHHHHVPSVGTGPSSTLGAPVYTAQDGVCVDDESCVGSDEGWR